MDYIANHDIKDLKLLLLRYGNTVLPTSLIDKIDAKTLEEEILRRTGLKAQVTYTKLAPGSFGVIFSAHLQKTPVDDRCVVVTLKKE